MYSSVQVLTWHFKDLFQVCDFPADVPQDPTLWMHLQSDDGETVLSQHLHIRRMEDPHPAQPPCTYL